MPKDKVQLCDVTDDLRKKIVSTYKYNLDSEANWSSLTKSMGARFGVGEDIVKKVLNDAGFTIDQHNEKRELKDKRGAKDPYGWNHYPINYARKKGAFRV